MTATATTMKPTIDQVLNVLQLTEDGDLLDPSDLSLSQAIVNGQELSEQGEQYWVRLCEAVEDGSYVKRHFCGIPGLTKDGEGYVYWKGKSVEHYSYPPERRKDMIEAARRLAAACMIVERRGTKGSPHPVLSEVDVAEGMTVPRHLVLWAFRKNGVEMTTVPIAGVTQAEIKAERLQAEQAACLAFDVPRDRLRSQLACTQEDFDDIDGGIRGDLAWARRASILGYQECQDAQDRFDNLKASCEAQAAMVQRQVVEQTVLGPELAQITEISERNISSFETEMNRFGPARERG